VSEAAVERPVAEEGRQSQRPVRFPVLRAHIWRTPLRFALPLFAAAVAAHLGLRTMPWRHEWFWATYEYDFVTVLLGPLLSCAAAIEGYRLRRTHAAIGTSTRVLRATAGRFLAPVFWALLAGACGLLAVWILVRLAGTPGLPDPSSWESVIPATAQLLAYAAAGFGLAYALPHVVVIPFSGIVTFGLTLFLYTSSLPESLIVVGGASGSTATLRPHGPTVAAQTCAYAAFAVAIVTTVAAYEGWPKRSRVYVAAAAAVAAVAAAIPLFYVGQPLEPFHPRLTCMGTAPRLCALPGYARFLATTRTDIMRFAAPLHELGVDLPAVFSQDPGAGDAPLDAHTLTATRAADRLLGIDVLLRNRLLSGAKSCRFTMSAYTDMTTLDNWLLYRVDASLLPSLTADTDAVRRLSPADVRAALDRLRRECA